MILASVAAGDDEAIPPIVLPDPLKPYADQPKVIDAATAVMHLIGTAKFDEASPDSLFAKPPCNAPEIAAFYRGLTLVQAGYFMFISKVERGFESVDSPHLAMAEDRTLVPAA